MDVLGLKKIPLGDWFCGPCVAKEAAAAVVETEAKASKEAVEAVKDTEKDIVTSSRQSSRASTAKATVSTVKTTPSKKIAVTEVASVVSKKRGVDVTDPSPAPEGRRSARLH